MAGQQRRLAFAFHAFGEHPHAQLVRHGDDGAGDGRAGRGHGSATPPARSARRWVGLALILLLGLGAVWISQSRSAPPTADAVAAATACIEGEVTKSLKNFLKKQIKKDDVCVADKNLGVALKDAISGAKVLHNDKTLEIFRGIRCYLDELLEDSKEEITGKEALLTLPKSS